VNEFAETYKGVVKFGFISPSLICDIDKLFPDCAGICLLFI